MEKLFEITEVEKIEFNTPVFILGFPDVGLVGTIAVYHIIDKLKLKEVAHIDSKKFPAIVVVHDSKPSSPMRVYGNGKIFAIISEIPIKPDIIAPLSKELTEWFKKKKASMVISLGGIPHPKRIEIEKPEIYGICSSDLENIMKEVKVKNFEEGIIVGVHGVMLRKCISEGVPSMYLMAESHYRYPDPEAAASVIKAVNKILNLDIDVKELIEKGEEIKIKARDLMRSTEAEMRSMEKVKEHEIPMMYR